MNILFVDRDNELKSVFKHIQSVVDFHFDFCEDCESGLELYNTNKYDMVIINFSIDFGCKVLDHILSHNPKQRIITISDKLMGSESKGGDYCQKHYNKRRLLKPVDIGELIKTIKNFDNIECHFKNKFDCNAGLMDIMEDIAHQYPNTSYDKATHTISSHNIRNILELTSLFNEKGLNYSVSNENTIVLEEV